MSLQPKRIDPAQEAKIGARVRQARVMAGISQEALSGRLGLTFQQVQKYEKGTNRISVSRLVEIAHITGQPISFFVQDIVPDGEASTPAQLLDRVDWNLAALAQQLPPEIKADFARLMRSFLDVFRHVAAAE